MKTSIRSILLFAVVMLLATSWTGCDPPIVKPDLLGTLSGVVREVGSETPLAEITVELDNTETTTDQNGRFAFQEVPVGTKTLRVSMEGFDAFSRRVVVQEGDNTHDISLVHTTYFEFSAGNENDYGIYLPPGVSTYRGVIFLAPTRASDTRGFASTIPRTTYPSRWLTFNEYVAAERQWSLRLAEKYDLALMGADVSAGGRQSLVLTALEQFAEESGHPELAQAPLLVMGFSFGGCFVDAFARSHPERTIGFINQQGGCIFHEDAGAARLVPGYITLSELIDMISLETITQLFQEDRFQGALWALAIEPVADHRPISDYSLLSNWTDTVLEARLPETPSPGAPVTLRAIDETSGWLGNLRSFSIAEHDCYDEDRPQASWLPTMKTAQNWQAFVSSSSVTSVTPCGNKSF